MASAQPPAPSPLTRPPGAHPLPAQPAASKPAAAAPAPAAPPPKANAQAARAPASRPPASRAPEGDETRHYRAMLLARGVGTKVREAANASVPFRCVSIITIASVAECLASIKYAGSPSEKLVDTSLGNLLVLSEAMLGNYAVSVGAISAGLGSAYLLTSLLCEPALHRGPLVCGERVQLTAETLLSIFYLVWWSLVSCRRCSAPPRSLHSPHSALRTPHSAHHSPFSAAPRPASLRHS